MITENLYNDVLIEPVHRGSNILYVVSGYASATFANRHLSSNENFNLNLIIGMPGKRADHLGYKRLREVYGDRFNGYYLQNSPPVHCKTYAWYNDSVPQLGYAGSANYSQPGFISSKQYNQFSLENPIFIKSLFDRLLIRSMPIEDYEVNLSKNLQPVGAGVNPLDGGIKWLIPEVTVKISFLTPKGLLPAKSGLNWAHRTSGGTREPNQAYLSLKKESRNEGFLPPLAETFTLITDDDQSFDCVVAQQNRKAIQTTNNNSELGRYIRQRIGLPLGSFVTKEDLIKYGRTDFTITKINEETFLLDLSVEAKRK